MQLNRMRPSMNTVVRFYLRATDGKFTRSKCVYMPWRNQNGGGPYLVKNTIRNGVLNGHMVYMNKVAIKKDVSIPVRQINMNTLKIVAK